MSTTSKHLLRRLVRAASKLPKSSRVVRSILYDDRNAEEFGNLYEHEKMLADRVRVDAYRNAIRRHVKPGDVVVDLGTGTGILSFFAARQGPRTVYALDHCDFIDVARKIAQHNGIDTIRFVKVNSRDFQPEEKVDVIVHEQIGDHLFDENMVENLLDLKRRTLKETGRIVPGRFEIYLEPVRIREEFRVPFVWEHAFAGVDLGFLRDLAEVEAFKANDYGIRWLEPSALESFLCEPEPLLSFDLNLLRDQDELPRTWEVSRRVTRPGAMDGLCFYFRVVFDDEHFFDTSPAHTKTHWGNRLFRVGRRNYDAGDVVSYRLSMGDLVNGRTWTAEMMDAPAAGP